MRNVLLILAGLLVVGAVGISRGSEDRRTPGRYQLISGRFSLVGKDSHMVEGLFRLDTATGDVDQYVVVHADGDNHGNWIPLRGSTPE
jgi:hypothetical protein